MAELEQGWINTAIEALSKAHIPYSHFPVGACLVAESGKTYQGINIENISFGLANCTERIAFFKAVSEGEKTFTHLVVAGHTSDPTPPCGACRQVTTEFCFPDISVTLAGDNGVARTTTVRALLPYTFAKKGL